MIIDPDFPDHWKTRMLVDLLSDELAPIYILRLWGHCQLRREWVFSSLPPSAMKAICRYAGHPTKLDSALQASGFIHRKDTRVTVHEWQRYNASLIAAWKNGEKGGRPRKEEKDEIPEGEKPTGYPPVTHGEPTSSTLILSNPVSVNFRTRRKDRATLEEIQSYCSEIGLQPVDAEHCFDRWETSGWKIGNQAIKDWKAAIRSWKRQGYLPSLKQGDGQKGPVRATV